ncbi:MAG: DUF4290 domain-containing protein [Tannerella sp.]|nr:DUF4290 domain-containing protein [Tannerella sp.]
MKYNTAKDRLLLPDYGRNIQDMVNHCMTIKDRDERNLCANSIINIMGNMFPHLRDINDFKHILWDHLAIMSDFKLDVDYPYEVVKKENLYKRPPRLDYGKTSFRYRHYGKILEQMIKKAKELEPGEERDALVNLLANHLKKSFMTWNKDTVTDRKILKDLYELSDGTFSLSEENCKLVDKKDLQQQTQPQSNSKNYGKKQQQHSRKK